MNRLRPGGGGELVDFRDEVFRRDVAALHRCGDRALAEFLADRGARRTIRTEIEGMLRRYARLDPATVAALGGDRT